MFGLTLGKFIVLIIVGAYAGSLASRVATLSREGFGRWINLLVGIAGAMIGNLVFYLFHLDFGLGDLKISFEDLIAAFIGSLLCIVGWWALKKYRRKPVR